VIGNDGLATAWGTTGIGIVRGPGQANTDISVTKMTRIGERQSVQFRAEAFNLPNHVNPSNPITAINNANFVKILAAGDPRLVQFALKYVFLKKFGDGCLNCLISN